MSKKKFEELAFVNGSSVVDTSYGAVRIGMNKLG